MRKYFSHYRALVMLGTPLIIGQIGVVLQNFADTLMIGHHTTVELAAASLVSNIFILGLLMAMGFALCMTPLIGKAYGQGDVDSIGSTVKNGLAVNTLAALVLMAVYSILYFFLDKLGQPDELLPYVRPYYLINLVSIHRGQLAAHLWSLGFARDGHHRCGLIHTGSPRDDVHSYRPVLCFFCTSSRRACSIPKMPGESR